MKTENYRESESVELKEIETRVRENDAIEKQSVLRVDFRVFNLWFFTKTKICSQGFQK